MLFASFTDLVKFRGHSRRTLKNKNTNNIFYGGAQSHLFGQGMEFAKVRPYEYGDDIRHIDWKVTARTDKPHSKIYQAQSDNIITLVIDLNVQMQFGTQTTFRSIIAAHAFSYLGFSALSNDNRVSALLFGHSNTSTWQGPTKAEGYFLRLLKTIATPIDYNTTDTITLSQSISDNIHLLKSSNIIFFISDTYSFDDAVLKNILLLSQKSCCHIVDIQDPADINLPSLQGINLQQKKGHLHIKSVSKNLNQDYQNEWLKIDSELTQKCRSRNINRLSLTTNKDVILSIKKYLSRIK
ncbi:MAG: DUF58 domain-containing protein [Francisellaceae bacterium]|jgi:uncharacterized protein (DUF58 family)|nr:DUF58 domain-containing protein [Francisellaceae bacterium]MBT6207595.1 DUF58 domain-containing protein [Francisellaceae bacterium]MBT6539719.1 DUF58 domain-containing protein [Francisellaceae bacterium]